MPGFFADKPLAVNAIEAARRARLAKGLPLIDLTAGNLTHCGFHFPPEPLAQASAAYFAERSYEPDPRGMAAARRAISSYYARRTPPLEIPPEAVFITASTSEAYRLLFSLLCDPGDNLLAPDVTYPLFDLFAEDRAVELRSYALLERLGWEMDEGAAAARDGRTRAMLIVSPPNPTGRIQRSVLGPVAASGLPLIVDEVFAEFVHDGGACPPLGALYPHQPVFHLNGISKMFGLPDIKIGWIALNAAACEAFADRLELLNDAYLSASCLSQSLVPAIFRCGAGFSRTLIEAVRANVVLAAERLAASGRFALERPQGGSFVFARYAGEIDEDELVLRLIDAGVLVHPGYFYGCTHGPHIMVSCAMERAALEAGLELLVRAV